MPDANAISYSKSIVFNALKVLYIEKNRVVNAAQTSYFPAKIFTSNKTVLFGEEKNNYIKSNAAVSQLNDSDDKEINAVIQEIDSVTTEIDAVTTEIDSVSLEIDADIMEIDDVSKEMNGVAREIGADNEEIDAVSEEMLSYS